MVHSVFAAGMATGIGGLPHRDPRSATELVLRCTPDLPAVPQLPLRSPHESMIAQWARAVPEVRVTDSGGLVLVPTTDPDVPIEVELDAAAHGGMITFIDTVSALAIPPVAVKAQITGPLTLS